MASYSAYKSPNYKKLDRQRKRGKTAKPKPPPPLTKEQQVCQSKHRHPDEATARAAASVRLGMQKVLEKLFVYRCGCCHGWHLTRFPQRTAPPATALDPVAVAG